MSKAPSIKPNTVSKEAIPVYQIMNRVNRVIPGTRFVLRKSDAPVVEMAPRKSAYRSCSYQLPFAQLVLTQERLLKE